jgi:hypothetical protein
MSSIYITQSLLVDSVEENVTPHSRAALSSLYSNTPPKPLNGGRGLQSCVPYAMKCWQWVSNA